MTRAVVFAYHAVGVRCLEVLRVGDVDVSLVATHEDDPQETVWFGNVAARARLYGIPVITPEDPNRPDVVERVRAAAPDLLFSFYYRRMLGPELLALPRLGAYNLHGSLLPKYRGAAPIQWAIARGEAVTGVTTMKINAGLDTGAAAFVRGFRTERFGEQLRAIVDREWAAFQRDGRPSAAARRVVGG